MCNCLVMDCRHLQGGTSPITGQPPSLLPQGHLQIGLEGLCFALLIIYFLTVSTTRFIYSVFIDGKSYSMLGKPSFSFTHLFSYRLILKQDNNESLLSMIIIIFVIVMMILVCKMVE